jgi:hypothetical protein
MNKQTEQQNKQTEQQTLAIQRADKREQTTNNENSKKNIFLGETI